MFKKILEKLGFIKEYENVNEKNLDKEHDQNKDISHNDKKDKDNSNTPDDIYPLW